jgi:dTDP-4-dehydrorhamnose reductase
MAQETQVKIYAIGAAGMLGAALVPYFESKGHDVMATDIDVNEPWIEYCDVASYHDMHQDMSYFKPTHVLNLAAKTDLEYCETHYGDAISTNAGGSANCVALAKKFNAVYVYISTAGIFDGTKEYYSDEDKPNPLCAYGQTKYWGELIAQAAPKHIVLRCGWQMGGAASGKDKKFVSKIMKQLKAGATELNVVTDKQGTPTYTKDFTKQIEKLVETQSYGVWNAVCQGDASRYDVAVELVHLLWLQDKVRINVVDSSFFKDEYFAERPASEKMLTTKLDNAGLNVMRHWKECLREYVAENPEYFKVTQETAK